MNEHWDVIIDLRTGGDWSLDLCFAGLHANGCDVLDVPYKDKHREWWDVIDENRKPDWGLERRTLGHGCYDDRHDFIPNSTELIGLELLKKRGEVTRVWLDERMESFQKYRELGLDKTDARVIVVAGHDRFWNQSPSFVASLYGNKLHGMLLDNWYPEYANLPFPTKRIGWSTNFDHYWTRPEVPPKKDIDISFVGYNSHPDRARYIDHIEKRWGHLSNHIFLERRPDSFDNFVPKSQMFDIMMRSKICLNLRGAADRGKTLRAYEIPYVGSFMLSQRVDDPGMTEDFSELFECDYFDGEKDLDEAIEFWLENEDEREKIAAAGHARAIGPLSVKERWREVLEWVNR
jgi:hypothetical protein